VTGLKYDTEKPPMALMSGVALAELSKVLACGAAKYAADDWRGGIPYRRLLSATLRHVLAYNDGEDTDPETGLSHCAHAMCCLMFLLEQERTRPDLDDRYVVPEPPTERRTRTETPPADPDYGQAGKRG